MSTHQAPLYTEKQRNIIDSFGRGQAVVAGAGCGKTTTLVAKCLALMERNPKARFCAVSFTEKSVRDLKESLARGFLKAGVPQDRQSHWVKTIHGLCSTILQEFPVQAGLQGGEKILLDDESSRLWARSVNLLWSQNDNPEINDALDELLKVYSKSQLESLFLKLRSLMSFGVEKFILKVMVDRPEIRNLWLVFQSIYLRYQHYKMREGALDFNDLEIFADVALRDPRVQQYYRDRFDLVMVDEFQDTNPLQGQILEKFVRPGYTNLCIVGDPKQSIYRFRDADVSVFEELTKTLPLKHLLDTNYRSRPEIIHFVNSVCEPAFEASSLTYEGLIPGRVEDETFSGQRVSRLMLDDESTLAKFLKAQEKSGIDLSEYVILARSLRKDQTQKFLNALDDADVPFLLGSGGRFYSDPRVQELVAFLKGWVSPKNSLSQVAALRAPWIGTRDETLLSWKDHYYERFFAESEHVVARALKDVFFNRSPLRPGQILEKVWEVADPELYTPLAALWHKSEALSSQGQRFEEVVQYFSRAIETDKIEKEIPPPAQKGVVRLLTVHGSKGLQFARVILLDFAGPTRSNAASQDLIWDRTQGVHLFNRDEAGKRDKKDDANIKWIEIEKSAALAESKRVFYVAITRAQEELILAWKTHVKEPKAAEEPGYNALLTDNWRAWVETSALPDENSWKPGTEWGNADETPQAAFSFDAPVIPSARMPEKMKFDPGLYRPRHSPSEWLVLNQCPLRYQKLYLQSLVTDSTELQSTDEILKNKLEGDAVSIGETVAEKGQRVHLLIEHEKWDELIGEFASPELGARIVEGLQTTLNPASSVEIYKELGFEVPLKGLEALVGMMDRLEINENEQSIRVVDYKWTAKPKQSTELLAHYLLQLQLYAWAASKLVSFTPKKIDACLIHFTANSVETVIAPESALELGVVEEKVKIFFERANEVLRTVLHGQDNPPNPGEYCRYCEFKKICPAWQK